MSKIAFIFAGQGAQYPGMGKDIAENFEQAMNVYEKASEKLGIDMKKLCFEGDEAELMKTENTQPSILTTSIAILEVLKSKGIVPMATAGLSLGEYSALVCANAIDFSDAVELVKKRGKFMQEAVPAGVGAMAAIMGMEKVQVMECLEASKGEGIVEAANFNCPGQIVISGQVKAVEFACAKMKEKGAKRAMLLPVSAPFHCSLLKPAGDRLAEAMKTMEVHDMQIPVVTNVTADIINNKSDIKIFLEKQVSSSVLWEDSVKKMVEMGADTFIEIGPGKALSGFVKKIDKNVTVYNVEDISSLEKTLAALESDSNAAN